VSFLTFIDLVKIGEYSPGADKKLTEIRINLHFNKKEES
jgi:hypothetical protein